MKMQQWTVGILLFDQVDLTDITGPSEVFHHAGYSRRDLHKILFGRDTPENHPFSSRPFLKQASLSRPVMGFVLRLIIRLNRR